MNEAGTRGDAGFAQGAAQLNALGAAGKRFVHFGMLVVKLDGGVGKGGQLLRSPLRALVPERDLQRPGRNRRMRAVMHLAHWRRIARRLCLRSTSLGMTGP